MWRAGSASRRYQPRHADKSGYAGTYGLTAAPGCQVVAATISKAAANGETKNITLQLEPPELGRVEVRMAFSKDKTVKAIVVAEKPETHLLLQRDGHLLERALFDSGLDAGGSSLSFELAHEGYDFNGRGGDGNGGYARNEGAPEEIIESTMTWRVDPETGHMRYSILA
ncbi:MAG: flagellar hook-length control protein FliK [Micavibrio sp.]|nr:flagellar hook-length control protein FliK [Micavibrio sp.]